MLHKASINRPSTELKDHFGIKGTSMSIPVKFDRLRQYQSVKEGEPARNHEELR